MPRRPSEKLSTAQRRLQALRKEVAESPEPDRFAAELAKLQSQFDDLDVAYEELEEQNEELQSTRHEMERQRQRYLRLFDQAPFGYLVTDAVGVVEEANRAAAEMFRIPQDVFPGKPIAVYLDPDNRSLFRGLLSRLRGRDESGESEFTCRRRDGTTFPVALSVARDLDGRQQAKRLRWAIRDLSQSKQIEEALRVSEDRLRHSQRMETVGRLAGGIAHSFNNLLAAIAFRCEILCAQIDATDGRRVHVEEIQKAGERAATLTRQLLAFGRKQVLQPRNLSLSGVIREMEPMLRRLIGEHIRLETRLGPGDCHINADLGQIEQVVLNLAVNARDAMPDGGSLLFALEEVETAAADGAAGSDPAGELPSGPYVQLTVADTGTGMSPEVLDRLFEPFFTTKERGQGTGLGLATVHGIVHQSGGRIHAESEPGQGSRFTVLLPRARGTEETVTPTVWTGRRARHGSEVVLLVEDEDNIREPAIEILESRGYLVLAAPDAAQALATAERHAGPIHILVTDVVMPGLSGSQLAEQLARRRPGLRVLYISGYPEDAISHHGVLHPEQHFLQKPFPPGQFLEKIREVLDVSPARSL
jgi:two-component system cell cycle sensor histidine kinase/response regulator CckA